jgi:HAD superfamily hydrolase (TIGR01509 family)
MRDVGLVIFDCDGVLVDSEVISNRVLAGSLTQAGLATTLADARRDYQGLLLADVVSHSQAKLGRPLPDDFLERFERDRAAAFERELQAVAGAAEAVEAVRRAGVAVCVASQGKIEKTRLSLTLTGLSGLFAERALFSAREVLRGKPHSDLFLHAARNIGVAPGRCAVVEDSPSGVAAAVAAGIRALGYSADSDEEALLGAGAEALRSLAELPGVLGVE